ncbi:MAG TPA: hypothetical protein VHN79_07310, partial [Lacunisphaera sp.]|nr:hypothetical protein [Lacunisphaera sp.]
MAAGIISFAYVAMTIVGALVFACALRETTPCRIRPLRSAVGIRRYALLGLVGAGCLVYDRLVVQRVDLTAGIAAARTEWATLGEGRIGISSPYSVAGNLLWAFAYVPLVYGHLYFELLRARRKMPLVAIALGFLGISAVSALNGGRMPLVFAVAILAFTAAIRRSHGLPAAPRLSFSARFVLCSALTAICIYVPFVLIDRAAANHTELPEYTVSSISYLRGTPKPAWTENPQPSDAVAVASLSVAQLVHPFWLLELIRDNGYREGVPMLASTPLFLLQKMGFLRDVPNTWTYSGLYLSLPGAAYHDAGWPGLVLLAFCHSLVLAWCGLRLRAITPLRLALIQAVGVVTVLSPLVPAFLAGPFPFLLVA